jgi:nicotinamidase-related amidase
MSDDLPAIDPARSALLIMDYQTGILERLTDADQLLARMADTLANAREQGVHIGYVRVAFADADYDALPVANKTFAAIAAGRQMHHGAPETAVHDAVAPEAGDIVVRKTRVGPFSTTDLDQQLRDRGIDTLILAGISTSGVVLSTVRDAADRDYRIYVLEDGSADPDRETHDFLIQKIFPRQAYVISIAELSNLFTAR